MPDDIWTPFEEDPEDHDSRLDLCRKYDAMLTETGAGTVAAWAKSKDGHIMGGALVFTDPLTEATYAITIINGESALYRKGDHFDAYLALAEQGDIEGDDTIPHPIPTEDFTGQDAFADPEEPWK